LVVVKKCFCQQRRHCIIIKGTDSPDIGFYLRAYKFKKVFSVGPLMVFTFFYYFVIAQIFKLIFLSCFCEKHPLILRIFLKLFHNLCSSLLMFYEPGYGIFSNGWKSNWAAARYILFLIFPFLYKESLYRSYYICLQTLGNYS
jgi:hypothetical protein